jgi:protein gp37
MTCLPGPSSAVLVLFCMKDLMMIPPSIARQMTGIEWCDFTGNSWIGCTRMPASSGARSGCDICYAETFGGRRMGVAWGAGEPRRRVSSFDSRMRRLDRLAKATGLRFSVFSLSLGDWLDPEVDPSWRADMLETVEACRNLNWLLLTHRPHLARKLLPASWAERPPENVWPGVTVDHPLHAFRWGHHADFWGHTGRAWVSAEPLAASLKGVMFDGACVVILGGASNTKDPAWAFREEWVGEGIDQWGEDRVFFKQHGVFLKGIYVGNKKRAGREYEGRILDRTSWPRHRDVLRRAAVSEAA